MIDDSSLEKLARLLTQAGEDGFTGNIQINFFKGEVSNVVRQESFKMADLK